MDIHQYRIWCNTESTFVTTWSESEPTVCPNNNTHEIDQIKTSIIRYIPEVPPQDLSGKTRVHQTSRPLGLMTYFTGSGDDPNDVTSYGTGEDFYIKHSIGDSTSQELYLDFNIVENETWIHEGYMIWENAKFDYVSLMIVPRVTGTTIGLSTNFNFYTDGKVHLIIPAAGDGTCQITTDIYDPNGGLIYIPDSDLGIPPVAFWNADWNSSTKKYENITAAPYGNGRYNMFYEEDILYRFVNKVPVLGNGFQRLQSSDTERLGHGMRFKTIAHTHNTDHDWSIACALTMHRDKTV